MPISRGVLRRLAEMAAEEKRISVRQTIKENPMLREFNPPMREAEADLLINNRRSMDARLSRLIDKFGMRPPTLYRSQTDDRRFPDLHQNTAGKPSTVVRSASATLEPTLSYLSEALEPEKRRMSALMKLIPDENVKALPQPFTMNDEWLLPHGVYTKKRDIWDMTDDEHDVLPLYVDPWDDRLTKLRSILTRIKDRE